MLRTTAIVALLLFLGVSVSADPIDVDRISKALAPYLNDDTFAVASVSVDDAWPDSIGNVIRQYKFATEAEMPAVESGLKRGKESLAAAREMGIREVSAVLAVADLRPDFGPLLVVTCENPKKDQIEALLHLMTHSFNAGEPQVSHAWVGDAMIVGSVANVTRYGLLDATPRADLVDGLKQATADSASAGFVLSPGTDVRRVIRELWPTLPEPFKDLDADLLSEGFRHLTLTIRKPPEWQARLKLVANEEKSAAKLKVLAEKGMVELVRQASAVGETDSAAMLARIFPALKPQQEGRELVVDLSHDNKGAEALVATVAPMIQAARESARRAARMNNLKQIALSMHNHHDVLRSFPAAKAICDENGKALLSWRVAVLPFVEEGALFQRFHLDEPWDSPHNLKLAKENMPRIFAQQMSKNVREQGKTTYLVPVAEGTGFGPLKDAKVIERDANGKKYYLREGLRFRQMTDGSNQTILCVQVADEHAVFWTKPEDWEPTEADPLAKLKQPGRKYFTAAFMDGHVEVIDYSLNPLTLWQMLTRAGGEVIRRE